MKIATWNVNGLRSIQSKGFSHWFENQDADLVCLQEIKCSPEQIEKDESLAHPRGFSSVYHCADKPGYSGLIIYSRHEPKEVRRGLGRAEFDSEGRWLEVDVRLPGGQELTLINSYWPNSQRDHSRLNFKLAFCRAAEERLQLLRLKGRGVLVCGDFNIAHREIDLKNPKSNINNAGFLPEERAWMDRFVDLGWVDTFRAFESGPGHYTWWSYRPGVRAKNIGWRLDYFFSNPEFADRVRTVAHQPEVMGSDHCPVLLSLQE